MRRVVSYGGPSSVPASQRLKHRLAETAGMRVFSDRLGQEQGFLAPVVEDEEDGRVLHSTSWATRNFFTTASNLKKFVKGSRFWGGSTFKEPTEPSEDRTSEAALQSEGITLPAVADEIDSGDSGEQGIDVPAEAESLVGREDVKDIQDPTDFDSADVGAPVPAFSHKRSASDSSNLSLPRVVSVVEDGGGRDDSVGLEGMSLSHSANVGPNCSLSVPLVVELKHSPHTLPEHQGGCRIANKEDEGQILEKLDCSQDLTCEKKLKHQTRDAAALKIQCYYRSRVARSRYLSIRDSARRVQAIYRGHRAAREYQRLHRAIVHLQRVWRRHRLYQKQKGALDAEVALLQFEFLQHRSATLIQSCWKAYVHRLAFQKHLQVKQQQNNAAVVIQRKWRSWQQTRKEQHERMVKVQAAVIIQAFVRGTAVRSMVYSWNHSAAVIQRSWRGHRQKVIADATVKIQAWWRGCHERHCYRRALNQYKASVIRLQCMWRRYMARQILLQLQSEKGVKQMAAICLQAHVRGHSVRQLVRRQHIAASTIQHSWRSYRLEKKYFAAVAIQRLWRGSRDRRAVCHKHEQTRFQEYGPNTVTWEQIASNTSFDAVVSEQFSLETMFSTQDNFLVDSTEQNPMSEVVLQDSRDINTSEHVLSEASRKDCVHVGDDMEQKLEQLHYLSGAILEGRHFEGSELVEVTSFSLAIDSHDECADPAQKGAFFQEILERPEGRPPSPACDFRRTTGLTFPEHGVMQDGLPEGDMLAAVPAHAWCRAVDVSEDGTLGPDMIINSDVCGQHEDWNDVQIDTLDQCLDTCLATLTPLQATSSLELDEQVLHKSPLRATGNKEHAVLREDGDSGRYEITRADSDAENSVASLSSKVSMSCGPSNNVSGAGVPSKLSEQKRETTLRKQPNGMHQLSMQRNEERLQHFAQVFLLQRHISHQQLRAQSAPPFPPPYSPVAGLGGNPGTDTGRTSDSIGTGAGIAPASTVCPDEVIEHVTSATSSPKDKKALPVAGCESVGGRAEDVAVDMIELLKKLDGVYGASQPHAEYLTSPVLLSKETVVYIGDEEETYEASSQGALGRRRNSSSRSQVVGAKRLGM